MNKFFKKILLALTLMLGMTFAVPQITNAKDNPFGDRGWICAGNKDFNITLFEDGTIWIVIYESDGTKTVGIYNPNTGTWTSNRWTNNY